MEPRKNEALYAVNWRDWRVGDSSVGGACAGAGQQWRDRCVLQGKWAVELCHLFTCSAVRLLTFVVATR
jgi:hypothetical protein